MHQVGLVCTARLIVAGRRLAAPGRMLRVPSLWAGCGWGLWGGPAGPAGPCRAAVFAVGGRSVCGWLPGGGEAGCCGVGLAVVPVRASLAFPGRQARVWWHIWQRVTGRWVTVTGKRREPGLPVTSRSACPAAVATPCPCAGRPAQRRAGHHCAVQGRVLWWHRRWCPGDDVRPAGCPCPGPPGNRAVGFPFSGRGTRFFS